MTSAERDDRYACLFLDLEIQVYDIIYLVMLLWFNQTKESPVFSPVFYSNFFRRTNASKYFK